MNTLKLLMKITAAVAFIVPGALLAEDQESPPLYISVDCMKSTAANYASIETDVWQPMHQEMVNQDKQYRWALYWVMYGDRSKCDYYTVTTFLGSNQLNARPAIEKVSEAVHPDADFAEAMSDTFESRDHVASELWLAIDGIPPKAHRYAVVNRMKAHDPDAYERMESRVFKPGHRALVDGGYRSGWAMYALVSPIGTSTPYDYATVDFVDHLDPVPMAEAMMTANPNRDLDELQELLDLREQVSSETWVLVAATEQQMDGE
ncbi:MAG: hypothetical protein HKN55_12895 [Woeseiaceae bacterium]|nr:hypothetical protein [Woeseiaceae bacterium]